MKVLIVYVSPSHIPVGFYRFFPVVEKAGFSGIDRLPISVASNECYFDYRDRRRVRLHFMYRGQWKPEVKEGSSSVSKANSDMPVTLIVS
jgi:hypothetical protein